MVVFAVVQGGGVDLMSLSLLMLKRSWVGAGGAY
jgi:hypothetical protein